MTGEGRAFLAEGTARARAQQVGCELVLAECKVVPRAEELEMKLSR